jgi:hypothetical protein
MDIITINGVIVTSTNPTMRFTWSKPVSLIYEVREPEVSFLT